MICYFLQAVILYGVLTGLGKGAFWKCTSLGRITIGNGVTSIGSSAFQATSITSITIPDSVTSIGEWAFQGCTSLARITIGKGVTSIESSTFQECSSLSSIEVDTNNPAYCSEDGILFSKDKTTLILYPRRNDTSYTIPNGVSKIESWAFQFCTSLTSITIPSTVESIGDAVFWACFSLTEIHYSGTVDDWENITKHQTWYNNTLDFIIHCTDGTIAKDGTVTPDN